MEMAMLGAGALQREHGGSAWSHGGGGDGLVRLALALLLIAGLAMTLETRGLHWLWALLT